MDNFQFFFYWSLKQRYLRKINLSFPEESPFREKNQTVTLFGFKYSGQMLPGICTILMFKFIQTSFLFFFHNSSIETILSCVYHPSFPFFHHPYKHPLFTPFTIHQSNHPFILSTLYSIILSCLIQEKIAVQVSVQFRYIRSYLCFSLFILWIYQVLF